MVFYIPEILETKFLGKVRFVKSMWGDFPFNVYSCQVCGFKIVYHQAGRGAASGKCDCCKNSFGFGGHPPKILDWDDYWDNYRKMKNDDLSNMILIWNESSKEEREKIMQDAVKKFDEKFIWLQVGGVQ